MVARGVAILTSMPLLFVGLVSTNLSARAADKDDQKESQGLEDFPAGATGGTHQKGFAHHGGGGVSNLLDHGGPVLLAPTNFYFLWWGTQQAFGSELPLLVNFVQNLGSVDLFRMMDQYTRSSHSVGLSYTDTNFSDSSAPPSRGPSVSTILGEVCRTITAAGASPDPFGMYAVLTSNFPGHVNYCAWHSWGTCNSQTIQVIYQPNPAGVAGCSTGVYPNNNQQADSTANTLSHEIFETVTDPDGSAWFDKNGGEIGDKCAWTFNPVAGPYTNLVGNFSYYIQQEWSNKVSGCVQH